jgi:hypothetical protein
MQSSELKPVIFVTRNLPTRDNSDNSLQLILFGIGWQYNTDILLLSSSDPVVTNRSVSQLVSVENDTITTNIACLDYLYGHRAYMETKHKRTRIQVNVRNPKRDIIIRISIP